MDTKTARPRNVDEYIDVAPKQARKQLHELRACIRATLPGAEEGLKWGMPAYSQGRILITFAAFKKHVGFHATPSALQAFDKELEKFTRSSSTVRFPLEKPLPLALIRKITRFRLKECLEEDKRWKTGRDKSGKL